MAASSGDINEVFRRFRLAVESVEENFQGSANPEISLKAIWQVRKIPTLATYIGDWIIDTRAIPKAKTKAVEKAIHALTRQPRKYVAFWTKHRSDAAILLEAHGWPSRGDQHESIQSVGPFRVHDTVATTPDQLNLVHRDLLKASALIKKKPSAARVLYGDVFIVGKLRKANTLAWYNVDDDKVYLRVKGKSLSPVRELVHELGHRYWYKFMSREERSRWATQYNSLKRSKDADLPDIGNLLDVKIQGIKGPIFVSGYDYPEVLVEGPHTNGTLRLSIKGVMSRLDVQANFPTVYAATMVEEYFAECFQIFIMGDLSDPHLSLMRETLA